MEKVFNQSFSNHPPQIDKSKDIKPHKTSPNRFNRESRYYSKFYYFCVLLLIIFAVLVPRLWNMRLLYTDINIRMNVKTSIERLAQERGWLISDIEIKAVKPTHVLFNYQAHVRGKDSTECFALNFNNLSLLPCSVE